MNKKGFIFHFNNKNRASKNLSTLDSVVPAHLKAHDVYSYGAQTCLHSCEGFLPHLVITHTHTHMHRFCDYCDVQKELDMDFDKVQKEKPEAEVPVIPVSLLVK